MVYDQVFNTLTHGRKVDLKRHHAAHEWPSDEFTAYRNPLLVNKQIDAEALKRWQDKYTKQLYLPCMPTAFPTLHRFVTLLQRNNEDVSGCHYALRNRQGLTPAFERHSSLLWDYHYVTGRLLSTQRGFCQIASRHP